MPLMLKKEKHTGGARTVKVVRNLFVMAHIKAQNTHLLNSSQKKQGWLHFVAANARKIKHAVMILTFQLKAEESI